MQKFQFSVFFKGMAMGAADIVPGVSGGTIAFITGIYELLIFSIQQIVPSFFKLLKEWNFAEFWTSINGNFLIALFMGILTSVFSLSKLISYLLLTYPELIWSFFFGLIVASVWHVGREIKQWSVSVFILMIIGAVIAFLITEISPGQVEATPFTLFFGGMIAICAMILPGISGSFILLLLGLYGAVLSAVKNLEILQLGIFALGCFAGLLSIANLLSWAFKHFHNATLAILTGFMIGALNKVWPWKQTLSMRVNSHGEQIPFLQANILPSHYEILTGHSAYLFGSVVCFILGVGVLVIIDKMGTAKQ